MTTWGRLTDLAENSKKLGVGSAFSFIFSQGHIQLFAIELNTGSSNNNEYGQLFLHGIDSKGIPLKQIGGEYANVTKDIKRFEGLPIDRITLYQEGDFYKSWKFILRKNDFVLEADTIKLGGEDLRERWGADIIGLTDESILQLAQETIPELIEYVLSTLLD